MEKLDRDTILAALGDLDGRLAALGLTGEICLYGGATMVLAFNARLSTRDLDAVFQPTQIVRQAASEIAVERGLRSDWLNDGVKAWFSEKGEFTSANLPRFKNLKLTRPVTRYLLAMKCLAARAAGFESQGDREDIRELGLTTADEVLQVVEQFYAERLQDTLPGGRDRGGNLRIAR